MSASKKPDSAKIRQYQPPKRSMALLWGRYEPPARGPRQGLTVAAIATAALELADAEGLDAVSMRRVAERLGRSAMSLYTYVPGKAELLDVMLDTVLGELPTSQSLDGGWRAALDASARAQWEMYQRHPWVLQVSGARPLLSRNEFDHYESQLRLLDGLGLTGPEMTRAVGAVAHYVRGAAKAVSDARAAERATGLSDDEWWTARAGLLADLATEDWAERYPTLTRLESEQVFAQLDRTDDDGTSYLERETLDAFEFGLQRLLDGIEAYLPTPTPGS